MPYVYSFAKEAPPPLDKVVKRIDDISTLPQIALRVMQVANDPDSGPGDLKEVLESDAALSARVLRCVNSAAFGLRERITNLQHAIAFLGLKQIRNLAMTASVSTLFGKEEAIGSYRRSGLWRHLVSVGICARLIAMRLKFMNFEDMFLAGLLHDVGVILEDQHVHNYFCEMLQSLSSKSTLVENEREHLGFDHTVLGEEIARRWGFPEGVRAAIRHHHDWESAAESHANLVACVEIANLICTLKGMSSVGVPIVAFRRSALEALSLDKDDIALLATDLDAAIASNAALFQM